jgi:hypothetical protein
MYELGNILLKIADWRGYWAAGSSVLDASDDTGGGEGNSIEASSLSLSPAEVEGIDDIQAEEVAEGYLLKGHFMET